MSRETTLSQAVLGTDSIWRKALLVLGGTAFIAVAAQVSIPLKPVPMTLQTLAILTVGFAYGSRLGAVTLLAYLAEGAVGLPVFANGANGMREAMDIMVRGHVTRIEMHLSDFKIIPRDKAVENFSQEAAFFFAQPSSDAHINSDNVTIGFNKNITRMHIRMEKPIPERMQKKGLN